MKTSDFRTLALIAALLAPILNAQVPPGRVALWRGENNALDSVGGNTGILPSGATFVPDRNGTGYAFRMNGAESIIPVVEVASGISLRRYTISAWVNSDATTPISQVILSKGGGGTLNYALYLAGTNDPMPNAPILDFYVGDVNFGTHYIAEATQTCTPGVWCHVAGSYDGQYLRIYVNGVLSGTSAGPDAFSTAGPSVHIGAYTNDADPFIGALDEISVFNRALTDAEVAQLYQTVEPPPAPLPPAPSGLVALWRGENNALDSVGGNTGVLPPGALFVPDRNGTGFAFQTVGTSSNIPVTEINQDLSLRRYTIAAWVKPDGTAYLEQTVLSKGGGGGLNYDLFLTGAIDSLALNLPAIDFYVGDVNAGIHYHAIASQPCAAGVWCHIAGTYDGQLLRIYVDGVLSGTATAPDAFLSSNPSVLIGGYPNPQYPSPFVGALDEISVFNRALSDDEVATLYTPVAASTTVTSSPAGLPFTADGATYTAPQTLNWANGSVHSISWATPIAGAPGSRLSFSGWSDGDTTNPRSYTATASVSMLTANFTLQYLLTTSAGPGGNISPASGWFNSGSTAAVSATAGPGYQFTAFSGDLTGSTTPQSVIMSAPRSIAASFGLNGQAVVQLLDSAGNPLQGGTVTYYNNGWKPFGVTDATGQAALAIPAGSYTFSVTYANTQQQLTQNTSMNPLVVFQTRPVTVQLKNSSGILIDSGVVQYYSNGWNSFGSTTGGQVRKELLPGSYAFSLVYSSGAQQLTQDVGANPVVVFQTESVTVRLTDSAGNPLDTGTVQYYAGGWLSFGQTSGGQALKELLPGTYSFTMTYGAAQQQLSQNIAANPVVVFQTKGVTVQLKDSSGNPLDTGTVQYYAGGWLSFGQTSGGQVLKELLPGTYSFMMTYGSAQQQLSQNIAANPVVVFQTKGVTVQLKDSSGNPLDTGTVQYYAGGWLGFGQTSGGQVLKELLPGTYSFMMTYGSAQQQLSQNVASNPVVVFQTKGVTVQLKDSSGNPLDTGTAQYYAGGWLTFGQTSGGQVMKELLPGTYSFMMTYGSAQQQLSQNVASNPVVVFQTKAVTVQLKDSSGNPLDTGTVQYYAGGWLGFGQTTAGQATKELLPGVYSFEISYGFTTQQVSQNIGLAPAVVFQTGRIHSGTNSCTAYYSGGWHVFSNNMELLPGQYTFGFNDGTPNVVYAVVAGTTAGIH